MNGKEVLDRLKKGWVLVVIREFETNYNDDIMCLGVKALWLEKSGEQDIDLAPDIFYEIENCITEFNHESLCTYYYKLDEVECPTI